MQIKRKVKHFLKRAYRKNVALFALFLLCLQTISPVTVWGFAENKPATTKHARFYPKMAAHVENAENKYLWKNEGEIIKDASLTESGAEGVISGASLVLPDKLTGFVNAQHATSTETLGETFQPLFSEENKNSPEEILEAGGLSEEELLESSPPQVQDSTSSDQNIIPETASSSITVDQTEESGDSDQVVTDAVPEILPEIILESLEELEKKADEVTVHNPDTSDSSFLEAWNFEAENSEIPNREFLEKVSLQFSLKLNAPAVGSLLFYTQSSSQDWQEVLDLNLHNIVATSSSEVYKADLPIEIYSDLANTRVRVAYKSQDGVLSVPDINLQTVYFEAEFLIPSEDPFYSPESVETEVLDPEGFLKMSLMNDSMEVSMPGDLKNPITLGFRQQKNAPDLKMFLTSQNASTTSVREGDVIRYLNVYDSTNVEYEINKRGFKENIILADENHPESFSYIVNLSDFDISVVSESLIKLYEKGYKDNPLKLLYKISAPYMEDAVGERSEQIILEVKHNKLVVVPDAGWLSRARYPVKVDPSVEVNVLNVHSHPAEGEFWDVEFTTLGAADLVITPADEATINDDEFVSLFCGTEDKTLDTQILNGDVIYYANWSCDEIAVLRHRTLYAGSHHLFFQFGDAFSEAFNAAYTWDGGGGDANWTTAANWSSDIIPTSGDTVTINNSCSTNCNPVINTTTTVSGLTISSATTTVTVLSGFTFGVGSNGFALSNGTFNGGAATTSIGGTFTISGGTYNAATTTVLSGLSYTININSSQTFYNLNINGTGGATKTISSGDTLVVSNDLILTDGVVNLSSYASPGFIEVRGNISQASTFDGGTAFVDFGNDSLSQTWTVSGGSGPAVRFNSAADANDTVLINAAATLFGATTTSDFVGTIPISNPSNYDLTIGGSISIPSWSQAAGTFSGGSGTTTFAHGDFVISGGVFNASTNTVFSGLSSSINVNSVQDFYNLNFNNTAFNTKTISSGDALVVNGNLYLTRGNVAGGNIQVKGNISQAAAMEGSSS
ncbi:MAG: hypothetical protein JNN11_05420, partial [Candidatus Doudnabacteria bacterium]|nr:hypothetical protein [Candidatus Doudnabacteria bacterium]